jgi:hypothetical protein
MGISLWLGAMVFAVETVDLFAIDQPWTRPLLWKKFILALNTTAVAFWIVFGLAYLTKVRLSRAALDWDRRMKLAQEIFKREKALGRGSWWM